MRIALEVKRWTNPLVRGPIAMWRDSEPFVENKRGLLIHRPRFVKIHKNGNRPAHMSVEYYCGNSVTDDAKRAKLAFISEPPSDALLCAVCEQRAIMAGLPTSISIVGRHVHVGKLKAIRVCCGEDA